MSGETRAFSRGRRMFRIPALLRSVLRLIPSDIAARPRFPKERLTAPTMYFFSNSFLARSREIPWARSSSMISCNCPSRFTSAPARILLKEGRHLSKRKRSRGVFAKKFSASRSSRETVIRIKESIFRASGDAEKNQEISIVRRSFLGRRRLERGFGSPREIPLHATHPGSHGG